MTNNNFQPQNFVGASNGIILSSQSLGGNLPLHFDKKHITDLLPVLKDGGGLPTHLGVMEGLNQINPFYRDVKTSLWNVNASGGRNILNIDNPGGNFTYDVPLNDTMDCAKIMSVDITGDPTRPGLDGAEIRIRTSKYISGANSIIQIGSKLNHVELQVLDDPRGSNAEGFLYRTRFVTTDADVRFVPSFFLQKGRTVTAIMAVTNEDNRKYDSRALPGAAVRRFFNTVGDTVNQKYFHVSRHAALTKIDSNNVITYNLKMHTEMFRMELLKSNSKASGVKAESSADLYKSLSNCFGTKDVNTIKGAIKKDIVHTAIIPQIEMYYMALIDAENSYYQMWGNGGTIFANSDRGHKITLPIGLFRQAYKLANRRDFELDNFSITRLGDELMASISRKYSLNDKTVIEVKTGMGGMTLVRKGLTKHYADTMPNGVVNLNEFITNKGGSNLNLGFQMGYGVYYHDLGHISLKFTYAPELDAVQSDNTDKDDFDNPYIGQYRLSSYVFIVDDFSLQGSNIFEARNTTLEQDFAIFVEEGKMGYLGSKMGSDMGVSRRSINSIHNDGYTVYIEKPLSALFMTKPDHCILYLPKNPKTRLAFGQSMLGNL